MLPGAQYLSQFHESGAKVFEYHPQSPGAILRWHIVAERNLFERPDQAFEMERGDHVLIAIAHQGRENLTVSLKRGNGRDCRKPFGR